MPRVLPVAQPVRTTRSRDGYRAGRVDPSFTRSGRPSAACVELALREDVDGDVSEESARSGGKSRKVRGEVERAERVPDAEGEAATRAPGRGG